VLGSQLLGSPAMNKSTTNSKVLTPLRFLFLSSFVCCSLTAKAVVFEVTTAEEFQAALSAAANNGGDDEIILSSGNYLGNFKFVPNENHSLKISGSGSDLTVLDGENQAYVLFMSFKGYVPTVEINGVSIVHGAGDGGSALRLTSDQDNPYGWGAGEAPRVVISDSQIGENYGALLIANRGTDLELIRTNVYASRGQSITCNGGRCSLLVSESNINELASIASGALRIWDSQVSTGSISTFWASGGRLPFEASLKNSTIVSNRIDLQPLECFDIFGNRIKASSISIQAVSSPNGCQGVETRFSYNLVNSDGLTLDFGRLEPKAQILNNLFVRILGGVTFSSYYELDVMANTFFQSSVVLNPNPSGASHELVNNIFVPSSDEYAALRVSTFAEYAALKNNLLPFVEGVWDVESENISGSPTFFDPENDDFHLTDGSLGVDGGSSSVLTGDDVTDLDGNARKTGVQVDIGAYERSTAQLHPADIDGDGTISQSEFDAYNAAWRTGDDWSAAPTKIPVDYVTRAGYLLQKGGVYKNIGVGKPATWVPVNE